MTASELIRALECIPPNATVCLDAAFAVRGKPVLVRAFIIAEGVVILRDYYLTTNKSFEFTSYDGQEYVVSYDNAVAV